MPPSAKKKPLSLSLIMYFVVLLCAILLSSLCCFLKLWFSREKRHLPPGSMGWPYIGETLKLYSQDPSTFYTNKQKRYGDIFKTHILGCPCVMVSSPEVARLVLVSQAHLFKPTFPSSKERLIGPQALFFQQGDNHARLRKMVQAALLPQAIKGLVGDIEHNVVTLMDSWSGNSIIDTFQDMKKLTFNVAILAIFGRGEGFGEPEKVRSLYSLLEKGHNSLPLNLPGTSFHRAIKARKELSEIVGKMIQSKRKNMSGGDIGGSGLLEAMLGAPEVEEEAGGDQKTVDNIIGLLFAAQDTTASVLTWILKYLHDYPAVLHTLTQEHDGIQKDVKREKRGLTWEDTMKMPFTNRVIQETMRIASVLSFTFREAVRDVELHGYVIPKGWKVLPLFRSIHHNAEHFTDPEKFDPSRFEVPPKPNTFLGFGNGMHSCPGNELAKLEMRILLHHFTLRFRWDVVCKEGGIQYVPFPVPKRGLPIRLSRRDASAAGEESNK